MVTPFVIPELKRQRNVELWSWLGQARLIGELLEWGESLLQKIIVESTQTHIHVHTYGNADNYTSRPQNHLHCLNVS